MGTQGHSVSERELHRIIQLLSSTEMTINEIAQRMSCSHSTVVTINRKFQIRLYAGKRSHWQTFLRDPLSETPRQPHGLEVGDVSSREEKSPAPGYHATTDDESKSVA